MGGKTAFAGAAAFGLALSATAAGPTAPKPAGLPEGSVKIAAICSLTAEMVNGGAKTCYYNCSGAGMQMTVAATAVCPLTVPAPRR